MFSLRWHLKMIRASSVWLRKPCKNKQMNADQSSYFEMKSPLWHHMKLKWLIKVFLNVSCVSHYHCREPQHHSVPYHYYEPRGPDECAMYISHERGRRGSHHRFITEKRVFANWARTFDIHFYQPDWSPPPLPANQTLEGTVTAVRQIPQKTWPVLGWRRSFRDSSQKDWRWGTFAWSPTGPFNRKIKHNITTQGKKNSYHR